MMLLESIIFQPVSEDNNAEADLSVTSKGESGGPLLPVLFITSHFFLNFLIALKPNTKIFVLIKNYLLSNRIFADF